jgi:hypothetical protein
MFAKFEMLMAEFVANKSNQQLISSKVAAIFPEIAIGKNMGRSMFAI